MRENRSALCTLQVCCRIILMIRRRRLHTPHATTSCRPHTLRWGLLNVATKQPPRGVAVCSRRAPARAAASAGSDAPRGGAGARVPPVCRAHGGSTFGQLALRSLLSAPQHVLGCPRLRPASAAQLLLERLWPATHRARSRHSAPRSSLRAGRPKGGRDPPPLAPVRTANR